MQIRLKNRFREGEHGKKERKKKRKRYLIYTFCFAVVLFFLAGLDERLLVREYTVTSDKVTQPVRFIVVSDLHSNVYGEKQKDLIEAIGDQAGDALLFVGDIADDEIPHQGTIDLLEGLGYTRDESRREPALPAFYVTGNHEFWGGNIDEIKEIFSCRGVEILEGECVTLDIGGQNINLCGIEDPDCNLYMPSMMEKTFSGIKAEEKENFTVLMAHRPEMIQMYLSYPCDLILSGHAHGGQWRIPGLVNGFYAPNQGFFPDYAGGVYPYEHTVHIVSRGLAKDTTKIPRFYNRPELVTVTVEPE